MWKTTVPESASTMRHRLEKERVALSLSYSGSLNFVAVEPSGKKHIVTMKL